jgi:diguanylate cyclase (GGDEF)-like protein
MSLSFRNSLFLLLVALLGVTLFSTMFIVLQATNEHIKANAEHELDIAERVFSAVLEQNTTQLRQRASLLVGDFGFKRAIATNEKNTITSVLANHGERIGADMMFLVRPDGDVIVSTHDLAGITTDIRQGVAGSGSNFVLLVVAEDLPYKVVLVPVRAPHLIAWVGLGFVIDRGLLGELKEITKTDIALVFQSDASNPVSVISTMDDQFPLLDGSKKDYSEVMSRILGNLQQDNWLSSEVSLRIGDSQRISALLSASLTDAIAAFRPLRHQVIGVGIVVMVLAACIAILLARRVSHPIEALVKAAVRIAGGDYSNEVCLKESNEFGVLGDKLNDMQHAIDAREKHIKFQAGHDLMTGLLNRNCLGDIISQQVKENPDYRFVLGVLQLANYEQLDYAYGRQISDQILMRVVFYIRRLFGSNSKLARLEGAQFLVIYDELAREDISDAADDMLATLSVPMVLDTIEISVEPVMSFVLYPEQGDSFDELLRRALLVLNKAQRNRLPYAIYQKGDDEIHMRQLKVTNRLQYAIANEKFEMYFQPQYSLRERRVHHAEALIRWEDEEMGRMFPDEFIPLAEQSGAISHISRWVFHYVVNRIRLWQEQGIRLAVGINLSAKDILQDELVEHFIETVECLEIDKSLVVLEITESAMISDPKKAVRHLQTFYDQGFKISMDDFGTGFSSLAQMKSLPIHELKIDKSFVLNLDTSEDDQKIVRSTIDMAHHLGVTVIAEGVENQASLNMLREMGCDIIQGFYLAKPMPLEQFDEWLQAFDADSFDAKSVKTAVLV